MTMSGLLDLGGKLWPEHHCFHADTLWTNAPPERQLVVMRPLSGLPVADLAQRHRILDDAKNLIVCYAILQRPEDDFANAGWHRDLIAALDEFVAGHYVGESDIVTDPKRAEASFAAAHCRRLRALRRIYDPDGLFLGQFGAS